MPSVMDDLVRWLGEQLDEDERIARRAGDSFRQIDETGVIVATEGDRAEECASANWAGVAEHIVEHDPARVLREIDAKRRIIAAYENYDQDAPELDVPYSVLQLLALPYAHRPGHQAQWRI